MPFLAPLGIAGITGLIGAGASTAGAFLNGKPKTNTSTSSTTPTLTPEMQALMDRLSKYSTDSMDNPGAGLAPIKNAAIDGVNRTYMDIPQSVATNLSRRGMGSSGANGEAQYRVALARGGSLSDLEGQFGQAAIDQQRFGAGLGQSLLNFGRGSSSTGTSTTPDTSLSSGILGGGSALMNLARILQLGHSGDQGMQTGSGGTAW